MDDKAKDDVFYVCSLISSGLIPRSLLRNKLRRNLVFDTP